MMTVHEYRPSIPWNYVVLSIFQVAIAPLVWLLTPLAHAWGKRDARNAWASVTPPASPVSVASRSRGFSRARLA